MNWPAVRARLRLSAVASLAGWSAATAATLPMQWFKVAQNATGGVGSLLWSLAAGSAIWAAWTLAIVAGGWLLGFLPAIALLREGWMLGHPRRTMAFAGLFGWAVVLAKFDSWKFFRPGHEIPVRLFSLYSLLLVIFPVVAARLYLRRLSRLTRRFSSAPTPSA